MRPTDLAIAKVLTGTLAVMNITHPPKYPPHKLQLFARPLVGACLLRCLEPPSAGPTFNALHGASGGRTCWLLVHSVAAIG